MSSSANTDTSPVHIYELTPDDAGTKSFYGKAQVRPTSPAAPRTRGMP